MIKKYCDVCGEEIEENTETVGGNEYSLIIKSWPGVKITYDMCRRCSEMFAEVIDEMHKKKGTDDDSL